MQLDIIPEVDNANNTMRIKKFAVNYLHFHQQQWLRLWLLLLLRFFCRCLIFLLFFFLFWLCVVASKAVVIFFCYCEFDFYWHLLVENLTIIIVIENNNKVVRNCSIAHKTTSAITMLDECAQCGTC